MAVDITTLGIELDTSDLRRGIRDLDAIGDSANKTAGKVSSFTSTATKAIGTFAAAFAGAFSTVSVAQKLIETERAMGVLNSSLITATGSAESAKQAFAAIQDLAGRLPESVESVADAFINMRNLGLDPSQKAIESYSNTAAAMGKSLNQMVEAVADAATGEFERLKEFGIKAKQQGDEVSFTFQGVTKTIGNSSEEITKYLQDIGNNNFAGAAAARMQTLDGAISNLQDSWDGLFRTINSQGAGSLMTDTVRAAAEAVQDLSDSIASGQFSAYLDAISAKFGGWSGDVSRALAIVETEYQALIANFSGGEGIGQAIIDSIKNMPENVRFFIQAMVIEIAAGFDRVKANSSAFVGTIKSIFTDDTIANVGARLQEEMARIDSVRRDSLQLAANERQAAIGASEAQIKAAEDLREKYDEQQESILSAGDALGKYGIKAGEAADSVEKITAQTKRLASIADQMAVDDLFGQYGDAGENPFENLQTDIDASKQELDDLITSVDEFGGAWSRTGDTIAEALGSMVDGIDNYAARMDAIGKKEEELAAARAKTFDPADLAKIAEAEKKMASERVKANVSGYRQITAAAASMFKEGSKGRKALTAVDQAMTAIELALSLKRGFALAEEAVLNQGKGDPYSAFARMAAMASVVGAIGFAVSGVGGGGSSQSAKDIQQSQGTGSVLGSNDKSESISKAFDQYLDVGIESLGELRKISEGLTGLSGGIDKLSIGVAVSGLTEAKYVNFAGQHLGAAFAQGGLSTRGSRSQDIAGREALAPLQSQIMDIFGFIGDSTNAAIKSLGLNAINGINSFYSDIGKVSFKGLSGEEIQQELSAIFSQQADLITEFLVPAMKEYQQMGEGLFETLTRVAAEMSTFNYYTDALGLSFSATGLSAIAVQQNIAELSGGMDKLTENMQTYYEEFFSEEERAAKQMELLTAEMKNLGYDIVPGSREGFRNLAQQLVSDTGLMTEESRKNFAGLMSLAEVFAELVPATESLVDAQRSAADIAQERARLERQLLQLQGDTNAIRALERAALHESNRAIYDQVNALQDQAAATREAEAAAKSIANQRYSLETQLLQAQGDTATLRARELEKLDESNRAIQLQVWALQDQKEAAEIAAQAQAEASRAQEQALDDARRAAEEQRKLAQGVHDSISDALRSLMGESEDYNQLSMAQARVTLQSALGVAKAGGSLVGFAGLDDALAAVQKIDASRYSSAFEYNQARGQNIGLLSQLEKYTRVDGSHANGLDYVPFDGYIAKLHRGERVQTASEASGQNELLNEIRTLRSELKSGTIATTTNLVNVRRLLEKWDGDGLPEERVA